MSDKPFVAPAVEVGQTVQFFHGTLEPSDAEQIKAAIVTGISPGGLLDLGVIPKDSLGIQLFESAIRHRDDPMAKKHLQNDPETGVWRLRPGELTAHEVRQLRELLATEPAVA